MTNNKLTGAQLLKRLERSWQTPKPELLQECGYLKVDGSLDYYNFYQELEKAKRQLGVA